MTPGSDVPSESGPVIELLQLSGGALNTEVCCKGSCVCYGKQSMAQGLGYDQLCCGVGSSNQDIPHNLNSRALRPEFATIRRQCAEVVRSGLDIIENERADGSQSRVVPLHLPNVLVQKF